MIYAFTVNLGKRHEDDRVIEMRKFRTNSTGLRKAKAFLTPPIPRMLYQAPEGFKLSRRSYQIWKTGRALTFADFALAVMRERGRLVTRVELQNKLESQA